MNELLQDFLSDTAEKLELAGAQLARLQDDPTDRRILANICALLHMIRGMAGILDLTRLEKLALASHAVANSLYAGMPPGPADIALLLRVFTCLRDIVAFVTAFSCEPPGDDVPLLLALKDIAPQTAPVAKPVPAQLTQQLPTERRESSVRVGRGYMDRLLALAAELVGIQHRLEAGFGPVRPPDASEQLQCLSRAASELQDTLVQSCMVPFERATAYLPQMVRDMGFATGKVVDLVFAGQETLLDRHLVDLLRAPLDALVRLAVCQSIEVPDVRLAAGKSRNGQLCLTAKMTTGGIEIEISDDGYGFDPAALALLAEGGATSEAYGPEQLSKHAIDADFLAALNRLGAAAMGAGFGQAQTLTQAIGGSLSCVVTPGWGARICLHFSQKLSIFPALGVRAGAQTYALSKAAVLEVQPCGSGYTPYLGAPAKGNFGSIPEVSLHDLMGMPCESTAVGEEGRIILVQSGRARFWLTVDAVETIGDIVLRPLPAIMKNCTSIAGAAITGDANLCLVLDPASIAQQLGLLSGANLTFVPPAVLTSVPHRPQLLSFTCVDGRLAALPLSAILRVEAWPAQALVNCGPHAAALRFEGNLLPLVVLRNYAIVPVMPDLAELPGTVLIIGEGQPAFALAIGEVREILSFVELENLRPASPCIAGYCKSAAERLAERLVEPLAKPLAEPLALLDLGYLLQHVLLHGQEVADSNKAAVLIIELPGMLRDVLALSLNACDCEIHVADDMEAAQALLANLPFCAAVIGDIALLTQDGAGFAQLPATGRVRPIGIGLCAWPFAELRALAVAAGLQTLLGRFDRQALLEATNRAIVGAQKRRWQQTRPAPPARVKAA